jgi:hypothetical protein
MTGRFHRHEEPLTSADLAKCQKVLETYCRKNRVRLASEEANRVAAIIIELYQQGVREESHLRALADAARGVILKRGTNPE